MPLEILHLLLVLLGGRARLEGAEIPALAGLEIDLPRVEPVFAGAQFADHEAFPPECHLPPPTDRGRARFLHRLPCGAKTWSPKGCSVGVLMTMKLRAIVPWQALQPPVRSPNDVAKRLPSLVSIASESDCKGPPRVVTLLTGIPEQ